MVAEHLESGHLCARYRGADHLGAELAAAFEARGALNEWNVVPRDPQAAVERDYDLAMCCDSDQPLLRIWRNPRALVVPRSFRNRPGFGAAVETCSCPVLLRRSGGTAVMHGPHILNVSLITPLAADGPLNIACAYQQLADAILPQLHRLGVPARLEDVTGAHCPGRFSIASRGRKLAGTAAFVTQRPGQSSRDKAMVAHASLTLETKPRDLPEISTFERFLGMPARYFARTHTSLVAEICVPNSTSST